MSWTSNSSIFLKDMKNLWFKNKTVKIFKEKNSKVNTKEFVKNPTWKLIALKTVNIEWKMAPGERPQFIEIAGTEKIWPCDLALLALGFTGPESTLADKLGIEKDILTNYKAGFGKYQTNVPNIFTVGDMRRGQSLIVWAISEGREAAKKVDIYLMEKTELPSKDVAADLISM
jgi:glutamate synthase (NADPH/NADH) small chain